MLVNLNRWVQRLAWGGPVDVALPGPATSRRVLWSLLALVTAASVALAGPALLSAQDANDGAQLTLEKVYSGFEDVDDDGALGVDDVVTYTFTLINSGDVALEAVALTDELLGLEDAACGADELEPGDETSCEHTYTITQADVNAGELVNQATATAEDSDGDTVRAQAEVMITGLSSESDTVMDESEVVLELPQNPAIALDKAYTGFVDEDDDGDLSAGDVLTYTFTITNTGNVTLSAIALDDETLELDEAFCGASELAPEASASCAFTYTLTESDILAGAITNIATISATAPDDEIVATQAEVTVELPQNPGIALEKVYVGYNDEDEDGGLSAGDIITYGFTITNTGNVVLDPVTLDDELLELEAVTCGQPSLLPGEMTGCEHTYTLTQADMDAGQVVNRAVVNGGIPSAP